MPIVKLLDSPADPLRFAFAQHLFTKRAGMKNDDGTQGKDKFELTAIVTPGGENEKKLNAAIVEAAKEKYGEKTVKDDEGKGVPNWQFILKSLDADRRGLRNGNTKRSQSGDIYSGFEGMKFITAKSETRPTVINRDKTPLTADDGVVYSGCYGNVHVDVWALKKGKPCIVCDLKGVQFTRDGDAFSSGAAPAKVDDFDDLGAGEQPGGTASGDDEDPFA